MKEYYSKRQKFEILRSQLEAERSSFLAHWRDLGDYILPRRPRFTISDVNKGERKNLKIIDSTASLAARTLRSGMMSGVTSPARPWFRLATPDPNQSEYQPIKQWLHTVTQRMSNLFIRSNLYQVLPIIYGDLGTFGTAAMLVEEDADKVLSFTPVPIGSYFIACDGSMRVNVFVRDFRLTVRQLVDKFGIRDESGQVKNWENFSEHVKRLYDIKQFETWIDVCHVVMPNEDFNPKLIEAKYKRFTSCYYERGSGATSGSATGAEANRFLRESGFDYFPVLVPRWEVTGEDVYGTECPGMLALGDVKALQTMQKRKAQAVEKMVNPPMVGPTALRNQKVSIMPGDITYADIREGMQGLRAVHDVNIRINELSVDIQETQSRIRRAFFEDLILMLSQSDRRTITAREIDERHEEKLLAFGPVLEQLNQDLLDPLIDIAFSKMIENNMIPTPPEEIQGLDLKVDYISVMAQAQKLVGLSSVERFTGFVANVASFDPSALDKVNRDQLIDVVGDILSVPPSLVVSDEDVEKGRAARAQAAQAQQQAEMLKQGASAAKDLSQAKVSDNSLLQGLIGG